MTPQKDRPEDAPPRRSEEGRTNIESPVFDDVSSPTEAPSPDRKAYRAWCGEGEGEGELKTLSQPEELVLWRTEYEPEQQQQRVAAAVTVQAQFRRRGRCGDAAATARAPSAEVAAARQRSKSLVHRARAHDRRELGMKALVDDYISQVDNNETNETLAQVAMATIVLSICVAMSLLCLLLVFMWSRSNEPARFGRHNMLGASLKRVYHDVYEPDNGVMVTIATLVATGVVTGASWRFFSRSTPVL